MVSLRLAATSGIVALAVLTGCSDGGGRTLPPPSADPAPTSDAAAVRPVDTSFTGLNSAPFCTFAKTYDDRFANIGTASSTAQLRTIAQEGRSAINQATAVAPAEIKSDVQVIATGFGSLFTALERPDFDLKSGSLLTAFAAFQTPQFEQSTIRFEAYLRSVCGVTG